MPVSYSFEVSNSGVFGMSRLFLRWRGGIFQVMLLDFAVYCLVFACIRGAYVSMRGEKKAAVEDFCEALKNNMAGIPVQFILGFFVSQVYTRWWQIFSCIPWPYSLVDSLALTLSARYQSPTRLTEDRTNPHATEDRTNPHATDDRANPHATEDRTNPHETETKSQHDRVVEVRLINQTIMRYSHLQLAMVLRNICSQFRNLMIKRKVSFVEMGLASPHEMRDLFTYAELMPHERELLGWRDEGDSRKKIASWNFWLPTVWASRLARHAYNKGYIDSKENLQTLYDKLHTYKGLCGSLTCYDWICIPLPYTQVVSIGIYMYFFFALFAYQELSIDVDEAEVDYHKFFVPFSLLLQFFMSYGWMKVAESLLNPMGDDEDFNFDMVGIFAMHLEQSRLHLEMSEEFGDFLDKSDDSLRNLARLPREDMFVQMIKPSMFGSLFDSVVHMPNLVMNTNNKLWKLPAGIWRNMPPRKEKKPHRAAAALAESWESLGGESVAGGVSHSNLYLAEVDTKSCSLSTLVH